MSGEEYLEQVSNRLIAKYKEEFKEKTGKDLFATIDRQKRGYKVEQPENIININNILSIVAETLGYSVEHMLENNRTKWRVLGRFMCMYIIRSEIPLMSLRDIGLALGNFDHTSIIHGLETFRNHLDTEEGTRKLYNIAIGKLKDIYESETV